MATKNTEVINGAGGEIVLYQPDESVRLEVRLEGETVWLTQVQMVELFRTTKQNISLHIGNIYKEGELDESSTVKEYLTVQNEGGRLIRRRVKIYNLDVIISVGYRIKSQVGTRFRIWASGVLKDYLLRGYSINRQLVAMQERVDERFQAIQSQIDEQRDKVEFLVKIHDRFLIVDERVYLLGTSLKDMGHTLSAVILTGFTAQEILEKLG